MPKIRVRAGRLQQSSLSWITRWALSKPHSFAFVGEKAIQFVTCSSSLTWTFSSRQDAFDDSDQSYRISDEERIVNLWCQSRFDSNEQCFSSVQHRGRRIC